jgi:PTS system nitrogen regulatory IIA component
VERGDTAVLALPALEARDAAGVLSALAQAAAREIGGEPAELLAQRFGERERLGSTAIGGGVALPHCRSSTIERPLLLLARSAAGVPFGAADGSPVHLFVAVVTPAGSPAEHLRALAQLSRRLRERERVAGLLAAPDAEAMLAAWRRDAGEAA